MDYKDLLTRYMALVVCSDGSSFLAHSEPEDFTDSQRSALSEIETAARELLKTEEHWSE